MLEPLGSTKASKPIIDQDADKSTETFILCTRREQPMTNQLNILHGTVHGKTIELEEEPGLPDGQEVTVTVQPVPQTKRLTPGEGIRQSAGSWSDDPEGLDEFLEWNRQQRKQGRPEIKP
jgi:hypothetical protein